MTRERRLEALQADWQFSNNRIANLSRLGGRDHVTAAIMLAREFKTRQMLKEKILALTGEKRP